MDDEMKYYCKSCGEKFIKKYNYCYECGSSDISMRPEGREIEVVAKLSIESEPRDWLLVYNRLESFGTKRLDGKRSLSLLRSNDEEYSEILDKTDYSKNKTIYDSERIYYDNIEIEISRDFVDIFDKIFNISYQLNYSTKEISLKLYMTSGVSSISYDFDNHRDAVFLDIEIFNKFGISILHDENIDAILDKSRELILNEIKSSYVTSERHSDSYKYLLYREIKK